jgi:uncharacterized membrane protein YphA (DoxX/SURF4 family)
MTIAAKLRRAPLRIVTGAYILNAGLSKFSASDDIAKTQHDASRSAYPAVEKLSPKTFVKVVGAGETALGAALLLPIVSPFVAGLGLTGFSGALLGMYWKTPGMHEEGSPRPTVPGSGVAKDVWMFGIGTSLMIDSVVTPVSDSALKGRVRTRAVLKAEAKAARKSAQRAAKKARKRADRVRETAESVLPS